MRNLLTPRAAAFVAVLAAMAVGLLAVPAAAARGPAAPAADDPASVAAAYLRARAAAVTSDRPASVLAPYVVASSPLAAREACVARGTALRQADLAHLVDGLTCAVTITAVALDPSGETAAVKAHTVTTVSWHARGGPSVEARGIDHALVLERVAGSWRVTADSSTDVELPALLERGGAPAALVRAAARRLEAKAAVALRASPPHAARTGAAAPATSTDGATRGVKQYRAVLTYDRDAVRAYADRYALSYNSTYVRFSADCCNFVSQSARAGGMPMALGDWTSGWWYDKHGTSSPSDDTYSWSWISCSRQIAFWLGTRIDWVGSIGDVGKGDVVYYDWTGDGSWDHVAVLVGTNSAGQKVIDAHTTDHYRVYWKLGSSTTRYKFGRVRASWIV